MNEEIYRAAMDAIEDYGDDAAPEALALGKIMKTNGRNDLSQRWEYIAKAIEKIQGLQSVQ